MKASTFAALPPSRKIEIQAAKEEKTEIHDPDSIAPLSDAPLSFGYGELLKDGAGEGDVEDLSHAHSHEYVEKDKKSLKGRYIVRVGWDDTRGWLGEGGTLIGSSRCPSCMSL